MNEDVKETGPDDRAGAAPDAPRPLPASVLTQAEIDALTSYEEERGPDRIDLRAVAQGGAVSRDPMPMLDILFDRFAQRGSDCLKPVLRSDVELKLSRLDALRFSDYVDGIALPSQMFQFAMAGWNGEGLITIGLASAYLALERLLGGGPGATRPRPVTRPPTPIETRILSQLVGLLLKEAERSFAELAPVTFDMSKAESDPRALQFVAPGETVLVAAFELEIDGRRGELELVLPLGAIEPIRPLLKGRFNGEKLGRDPVWSAHLATEIWQADLGASAVLHEMRLPLGRVLDLAVGETLMLDVRPTDLVTLKCGKEVLTRGRIGRVDGRIAIQVTEALHPGRAAGLDAGRLLA